MMMNVTYCGMKIIHLFLFISSAFQGFSDKTPSSVRDSAFAAYPIHVVFFNISPSKIEWLINNELRIVGFFPVFIYDSSLEHGDVSYGTISTHGGNKKLL